MHEAALPFDRPRSTQLAQRAHNNSAPVTTKDQSIETVRCNKQLRGTVAGIPRSVLVAGDLAGSSSSSCWHGSSVSACTSPQGRYRSIGAAQGAAMSHESGCIPQDPVENCNELVVHVLRIIFNVCPAATTDLADLCSLQAASTACRAAVQALPSTKVPRCVTLTRGRQQLDDFCAFLPALSSRNFALTLTELVITNESPTGFNDWGMWHAALGPVLSQLTQLQSLTLRGAEADPKVTVRNNAVCSTPALPSSVISCMGGMSHLTCLELSVVRPADVQKLPTSLVQAKLSVKLLQDDFQQHHHDGMCLLNGVWTMLVPLRLDRMHALQSLDVTVVKGEMRAPHERSGVRGARAVLPLRVQLTQLLLRGHVLDVGNWIPRPNYTGALSGSWGEQRETCGDGKLRSALGEVVDFEVSVSAGWHPYSGRTGLDTDRLAEVLTCMPKLKRLQVSVANGPGGVADHGMEGLLQAVVRATGLTHLSIQDVHRQDNDQTHSREYPYSKVDCYSPDRTLVFIGDYVEQLANLRQLDLGITRLERRDIVPLSTLVDLTSLTVRDDGLGRADERALQRLCRNSLPQVQEARVVSNGI